MTGWRAGGGRGIHVEPAFHAALADRQHDILQAPIENGAVAEPQRIAGLAFEPAL